MTNEQAKQEAIKKAYGDLWPTVEEFTLMTNGACMTSFFKPDKVIFDFRKLLNKDDFRFSGQNGFVIPKSIDGIHNNNGWIRIEPDGSNLPTIQGWYKVLDADGYEEKMIWYNNGITKKIWLEMQKKHYKPIKEELKPIY